MRSPEDFRALLASIGFTELAWEDLTAAAIARLQAGAPAAPTGPPAAPALLHGDALPRVQKTLGRNHAENRVPIVQAVFQRS